MEKNKTLTIKENIAIGLLLFLTVLIYQWIYYYSTVEDIGFNTEHVKNLNNVFHITWGSQATDTVLPAAIDAKAGEKVILTATLSASDIHGGCIAFYKQQSFCDIYVNGKPVLLSDTSPDLPFPMSPGSRWYVIRLPQDDTPQIDLRIETVSPFAKYAQLLPAIYTGHKSSILYMVIHNAKASLMTGIPALVLGLTCILLGLFLRKKKVTNRLTLLGLLAMDLSVWFMLESRMTQLISGNLVLYSFILFTCYNLIPVLISALLLTFRAFNQKYVHVLFWLSCAAFLAVQALQIAGIFYYINMIFTVHILVILIILTILFNFILYKKRQEPTNDSYIYRALIMLASFSLIDIIHFYINPTGFVGTWTRVGLLLFIGYLAYSAIVQFYQMEMDAVKHRVYEELALKDLMTGLSNRTSFEQEISRLRETPLAQPGNIYFFYADVNNLKLINDNYGHSMGDDCIIKTAHILQECFLSPCTCYRIGGDEFCVICRGFTEKDMAARQAQVYTLVQKMNEVTVYPYSVACGYHVIDENGVDACLKKADTMMYQEKARLKEQNA